MEIKSKYINDKGEKLFDVVYSEAHPLIDLDNKILQGVRAFCFCGDKMVLVEQRKNHWIPPGGGIEPGETFEEAVIREVKEETNMKVVSQTYIGYIDSHELQGIKRQTRSFCIVEPYGDFVCDPDGDITEIKLIDPKEYKKYFDWGEIGDRIMQIAFKHLSETKR